MIDEKDKQFIAYLRNNARTNLTTISRKTQIPISTLYDRLKTGEKEIIIKHTTLLDFSKIGFSCRAHVAVKVERQNKDALKNFLVKSQNVNSLYKINNGFDFLAELIFRNIVELEEFIETIDYKFKLFAKQVFYVIEELTRENFMTEHQH